MIPVCPLVDLPPGRAVRLEGAAGGAPLAVFNADGELYSLDDTCTPQDASLADGYLEECWIECPLHASSFDLRTGRPTGPPAKRPVRTPQVTVHDGMVYVIPSSLPAPSPAPVAS